MREIYEDRCESVLSDYVPKLPPAVHGAVVQYLADLQARANDEGQHYVIGICAAADAELSARVVALLIAAAPEPKDEP